MKKISLTKAARADLRGIYAYTYVEWGEQQADTYLGALREAMDRIADGTGTARPLRSRHANMFKQKQGRHLIVFRQQADGRLLVVRVLHDRMDMMRSWKTGAKAGPVLSQGTN